MILCSTEIFRALRFKGPYAFCEPPRSPFHASLARARWSTQRPFSPCAACSLWTSLTLVKLIINSVEVLISHIIMQIIWSCKLIFPLLQNATSSIQSNPQLSHIVCLMLNMLSAEQTRDEVVRWGPHEPTAEKSAQWHNTDCGPAKTGIL